MAFRIFFSYSTADIDAVRQAKNLLETDSIKVFLAEDDLRFGEKIPDRLKRQIRQADLLVVFWSKAASQSEWVPQEIGIAEGVSVPVLSVLFDGIDSAPGFVKTRKHLQVDPTRPEAFVKLSAVIQERAARKSEHLTGALLGMGVVLLVGWLGGKDEDKDDGE